MKNILLYMAHNNPEVADNVSKEFLMTFFLTFVGYYRFSAKHLFVICSAMQFLSLLDTL